MDRFKDRTKKIMDMLPDGNKIILDTSSKMRIDQNEDFIAKNPEDNENMENIIHKENKENIQDNRQEQRISGEKQVQIAAANPDVPDELEQIPQINEISVYHEDKNSNERNLTTLQNVLPTNIIGSELVIMNIPEVTDMVNTDEIFPENYLEKNDNVLSSCIPLNETNALELENNILSSSDIVEKIKLQTSTMKKFDKAVTLNVSLGNEREIKQDAIQDEHNLIKRKRRKRQFVNEGTWNENKKKLKREKGEIYLGKRKINGQWNYNTEREERKLKKPLKSNDVKRHKNRRNETTSRRKESMVYHMKKQEELIRVCRQMFLNTHGLKENMVLNWLKKDLSDTIDSEEHSSEEKITHPKCYKDLKLSLTIFFSELSKVESHYCRSSSDKLYLEPNWKPKASLFQFYKRWCQEKQIATSSIASFCHVFEKMNLSLFRPKKDECDKCVAYRNGNLPDDVFNLHQEKKIEARDEKNQDKESAHRVFCIDLHFLKDHIERDIEAEQKIIMYSDGCTSQNRNSTLANALLNLCMDSKMTIEQKFLEKGHTQMEADSMHSTIERKLCHTNINVPADYVEICRNARKNPRSYTVHYLDHGFFKDFSNLLFVK
ncbi:unnamed protein product [Psylliodes chrysocephalus]|uniref:Uncharacterized protein n=1 Tax=Psylliodes chrysocephalus TaxID=3402493 RepID=A0A9P0D8F5_9CUCU|nr:unnamed protein product [Psylliodes chrysocephala]